MNLKQFVANESRERLLRIFSEMAEPSVGGILVHRNQMGTSRRFAFFVVENGIIRNISNDVSKILKMRFHENSNSIIIPGCGFDAFLATINHLEQELGININSYRI